MNTSEHSATEDDPRVMTYQYLAYPTIAGKLVLGERGDDPILTLKVEQLADQSGVCILAIRQSLIGPVQNVARARLEVRIGRNDTHQMLDGRRNGLCEGSIFRHRRPLLPRHLTNARGAP